MKANRLAKSELSKLFYRPAIYFMTAFLVLTLVIFSFFYTPTVRENNLVDFNENGQTMTVGNIYDSFISVSSTNPNAKINLDTMLTKAHDKMINFSTNANAYKTLLEKSKAFYDYVRFNDAINGENGTLYKNYKGFASKLDNAGDIADAKTTFVNSLTKAKELSKVVFDYLDSDTGITIDNIDFYVTQAEINDLKAVFKEFFEYIPVNIANETNDALATTFGDKLFKEYNFKSSYEQIKAYESKKIVVGSVKIQQIEKDYYSDFAFVDGTTNSILDKLFDGIKNVVNSKAEFRNSSQENDVNIINKLITQYKNACVLATDLLSDSFDVAKSGGYNNITLNEFFGFKGYNLYSLRENIVINNYILEQATSTDGTFDNNYLLNLNTTQTISSEPSAYDFTFYAMQVLSIIITIFALFFTVSSFAGEQTSGTMKMLAIRPIKRDSIVTGKILACTYFTMMFLIIATIASFVVGYSMFGFIDGNIILALNAQYVFALPPYLVLLLYLVNLIFNTLFYILIASVLAVIFRSTTFSLFVSFIIYFAGIIMNGLCSATTWFSYTPYAHLDLFKFLGGANENASLLGMNMTVNGNFIISLIIIITTMAILNCITKFVFRKRDIA